jgi:hypothetical protein
MNPTYVENNIPNVTYLDNSYMKHVGWTGTVDDRMNYNSLWAPARLQLIQQKITQLLQGVRSDGRNIIVPIDVIGNVLSQVYETNSPQVGSIYSRYIQENPGRNDVRDIVDRSINIIVSQIKNEILNEQNNKRLTIWNTVLGDFNSQGLRAHAPIKIRKKRPATMQFNMNY